jgi:hypothetical protein
LNQRIFLWYQPFQIVPHKLVQVQELFCNVQSPKHVFVGLYILMVKTLKRIVWE